MKQTSGSCGWALTAAVTVLSVACGSSSSGGTANQAGSGGPSDSGGSSAGADTAHSGSSNATSGNANGGSGNALGGNSSSGAGAGGRPAGWLYTEGSKLKVSDGKGSGSVWVGRGVNVDDIFFCGYNNTLWMPAPGDELKKVIEVLIADWKPNFIRLSLSMASNKTTVSWFTDTDKYQKPMVDVVRAIGKHDGVYVLLTLRSDSSMIGLDMTHGDPEATGIPSNSTTTPDPAAFPTGTDPVYRALVDTFKDDKFVAFGLTNEPGGNLLPNDQIRSALEHAVDTIRNEEDKLGVPHHLISVQGQNWTSDIGFYATQPVAYDNVVYETHGYPPKPEWYTFDNLPVIIGEYGSLDAGSAPGFFADVEAKQLSNLAWDFNSYSNCSPDLLQVNQSSTELVPTDWGSIVKAYLRAHAL